MTGGSSGRSDRQMADAALLAEARRAYEEIARGQPATAESLAPVVRAAQSPHRPVCETATTWLARLTEASGAACVAVETMLASRDWHARFAAILSVGPRTPGDLVVRVLRAGLADKSVAVREKAADWAGRLDVRGLATEVASAAAREQHPRVRELMEFEAALLRDGYLLKPALGDSFHLLVRSPTGISGRTVTRAEIDERGIQALVAGLR